MTTVMFQLVKLEGAVREYLEDLEKGGYNSNTHRRKLARLVKYKGKTSYKRGIDVCRVEYRVEKLSEQEKAILFDYDGIAEDNKITKIMKKEGY